MISGTTLNNHSSATLETGWPYSLYLYQGATINNLAGTSCTIAGSGGTVFDRDSLAVAFNNAGTLTCDVAVGGTFDMSAVVVANTGSVVVQQGSLYLGERRHRGARARSPAPPGRPSTCTDRT